MTEKILPNISALMPVFNTKEEHLREAIESILAQTFTNFELIIVNDGSTNNAEEVITEYANKDKRIVYAKNPSNLGIPKTRNYLLSLAQGKYVCLTDSDDISLPERFAKQFEFMETHQEIGVCGSFYQEFGNHVKEITHLQESSEIKYQMLFKQCEITQPTVIMRKKILTDNSIVYNENYPYSEDYTLWLALADKTDFANLPEFLVKYRRHSENVTVTHFDVMPKAHAYVQLKAQEKFFNEDFSFLFQAYEFMYEHKEITSTELAKISSTLYTLNNKIITITHNNYQAHKVLYRNMLKQCKKDKTYYNLLWTHPLNSIYEFTIPYKIKRTFI